MNWKQLQAPFGKHEVKTKTVSGRTERYITARQVMNRLDEVCAPDGWYDVYRVIDAKHIECTLFILCGENFIGKTDVGEVSNFAPVKGAYSDAFKRAAVRWGIGRELYQEGVVDWDDETAQTPRAAQNNPQDARNDSGAGTAQYLTYDNWPAMRDWLIGAQLADNETHAFRRLVRVLNIDENAPDGWSQIAQKRVTSKEVYALFVARIAEKEAEEN